MTLNEIAYNIRNVASGGIGSDDTDLSLRQIKFMIHYHRANLLISYTDAGRKSSNASFQVDKIISKANGVDLKPFVGFNNDRAIRSISLQEDSSTDSEFVILPIVNHHDRAFVNESRFIKKSSSKIATISDRKLYVWEGESIYSGGLLEVNAIFSNPTEVSSYVDDNTTPYPMPDELISILVQNILKIEFSVISAITSAGPNNQVDEKQTTSKPK